MPYRQKKYEQPKPTSTPAEVLYEYGVLFSVAGSRRDVGSLNAWRGNQLGISRYSPALALEPRPTYPTVYDHHE